MAQAQAVTMYVLLGLVLSTAAAIDWKTQRIPNRLVYPAVVAGFFLALGWGWLRGGGAEAWGQLTATSLAFFAALVPFTFFFVLGAVGGGDVKLMAAVGALSGRWEVVLGTALYGFMVGFVMAVAVMVRRGLVKQTARRIWVALVAWRAGSPTPMPQDSPRLPYALAFAIGGLIAGAEHLLGLRMPWSAYLG